MFPLRFVAVSVIGVASGQDLFLQKPINVTTSAGDPCSEDAFKNTAVCVAKRKNSGCWGPSCWSCDGPLTSTTCVKSSWHGWKSDHDKFAAKCSGQLVRWAQDSGVQDCGVPCFGCSYIRACCDDCTTVLKTVGSWARISCSDVDVHVDYSWGVQKSETEAWSRTEKWTASVSASAKASGVVEGINGELGLTAESSTALEQTQSQSWSVTSTENTKISYTQPAQTCSWHWQTTITDSCGERVAQSKDFIITKGDTRGNSPCCLPGLIQKQDGTCPPDNAGNVINLC